jgi:3-methylcrotonyl-CoA carboxylase alpha subunit
MITGLDLVEWQLRVAFGEKLPLSQEQLTLRGHAIEARIYAEDPSRGFLPSIGKLLHLSPPLEGAHVRVDAGVEEGDSISPFYDPMIAKLIVWDETRDKALARMRGALADFRVAGVANNIDFLSRLIDCPSFAGADLDTGLIERESAHLFPPEQGPPDDAFFVAALAKLLGEAAKSREGGLAHPDGHSPWDQRDGWRLNGEFTRQLTFRCNERSETVEATYLVDAFRLKLGEREVLAHGALSGHGRIKLDFDGRREEPVAIADGGALYLFFRGRGWRMDFIDPLDVASVGAGAHGGLLAPMPGRVIALLAEVGAHVEKGAPLLILEAMKMEHKLSAPAAGVVTAFRCAVDDQVNDGAELVDFEPDAA